jgi:hypothetical protein
MKLCLDVISSFMTISHVFISIVGIAVVLLGLLILKHQPRWRSKGVWKYESKPRDADTLTIWVDSLQRSGFAFEVGLQSANQCQMSFDLTGEASCSANLPGVRRARLEIYSDVGVAMRETNIVGRGKVSSDLVGLRIFLPPAEVYHLFGLLRDADHYRFHFYGFLTTTGEIKIDYFYLQQDALAGV